MEFTGGHIKIMLVIEITKMKSTGGHIGIMLITGFLTADVATNEVHCIEMAKLEFTGVHIGFNVLIYITKMKLNYANYRDGQNRINRRPYWIYYIYIDYQNEIRIMPIIEMAKI